MPNQNTSGPNQPLNQHPLPINKRWALGQDMSVLSGLVTGQDYQIVAPPPDADTYREISPVNCIGVAVGAGAADVTDLILLWKDGNGFEYVFETKAGPIVADTAVFFDGFSFPFWLTSSDGGMYIRFTGGAGGDITAYASYQDVRGVERSIVDLDVNAVSLLPAAPDGNTVFLHGLSEIPGAGLEIANFDGVAHNILFELYNGTISIPVYLPATLVALSANPGVSADMTLLAPGLPSCLHIPPGFELRATLQEALNGDGPVRILSGFGRANQAPVRVDQGGAY